MTNLYFWLPNCYIARNLRAGSMSVAQAALTTYYPAFAAQCQTNADYWQTMPTTVTPTGNTYLLVRDPVDRFLSALTIYSMDLATGLSKLPVLMANDDHFILQSSYTYTQAFQFPSQLPAFQLVTGLLNLQVINETLATKVTLTHDQTNQIYAAYAADLTLYNSLGSTT